ncbi:MBL fold metallo-hydrolase [Akkermansiaceae bacterium]|nr:MBL fold metallo-hydrolase [Akkermansiaceae bacterium]
MSSNESASERNSGLLPKKGWPGRNYRFWRYRLLPQILKKREGHIQAAVMTPPEDGKVRATWIGHATFLVQFGDHAVIFDPNWANWHGPVKRQCEPGLELRSLPELDLVLVSHAHFDHLHKPSLRVIEAEHGIVVPKSSGSLVKGLGFSKVQEMAVWEESEIGGMRVVHTPSHHWGARYGADTHRDYGGFLVGSGHRKVFHAGDSAYFDGFKEIGKREEICVAILPIGAYDAPSGRDVHMNQTAHSLGMTRSNFVNPHGLTEPGQYSTASDMAILARAVYQIPYIRQCMRVKDYVFTHSDGRTRPIKNTNRLLTRLAYCDGMKTGTTNAAGRCLISSGQLNGRAVIAIALGSNSSEIWNDSEKLLRWSLE